LRYTRHRMCLLDGRVSDDRYRLFASTFKPVRWTYTGAKALTSGYGIGALLTFWGQGPGVHVGQGGASPVAARYPSIRVGLYCMPLRRFFTIRVRSAMPPGARLAMLRFRLDQMFSVGFSSGA